MNTSSGQPASRNIDSMVRAQPTTFGACLRIPTLPAVRCGAAKRNTYQNGKVSRHDRYYHSERFVRDVRPTPGKRADQFVLELLVHAFGVVLTDPDALSTSLTVWVNSLPISRDSYFENLSLRSSSIVVTSFRTRFHSSIRRVHHEWNRSCAVETASSTLA